MRAIHEFTLFWPDHPVPSRAVIDQYVSQQLLEIWNKAKGKERDIMLWGDEVLLLPPTAVCLVQPSNILSFIGRVLGCDLFQG